MLTDIQSLYVYHCEYFTSKPKKNMTTVVEGNKSCLTASITMTFNQFTVNFNVIFVPEFKVIRTKRLEIMPHLSFIVQIPKYIAGLCYFDENPQTALQFYVVLTKISKTMLLFSV